MANTALPPDPDVSPQTVAFLEGFLDQYTLHNRPPDDELKIICSFAGQNPHKVLFALTMRDVIPTVEVDGLARILEVPGGCWIPPLHSPIVSIFRWKVFLPRLAKTFPDRVLHRRLFSSSDWELDKVIYDEFYFFDTILDDKMMVARDHNPLSNRGEKPHITTSYSTDVGQGVDLIRSYPVWKG